MVSPKGVPPGKLNGNTLFLSELSFLILHNNSRVISYKSGAIFVSALFYYSPASSLMPGDAKQG